MSMISGEREEVSVVGRENKRAGWDCFSEVCY